MQIDQLMADAKSGEEITGQGRSAQSVDGVDGGAGDGGRADRPPRL